MQLIIFTKMLKDLSRPELIRLAQECGLDGFDLCLRPGYDVNPDNAAENLPQAVAEFKKEGFAVPMITARGDLTQPGDDDVKPLLTAMDASDVRILKLGYFHFDPATEDYWQKVEACRRALAGWEKLSREYNVKIVYHTHSRLAARGIFYMGFNASSITHLLHDFDPAHIGASFDPGHLIDGGEEFQYSVGVAGDYLSVVAVKDMVIERAQKNGHGISSHRVVEAGRGLVDWTATFDTLAACKFSGPISVHYELEELEGPAHLDVVMRESAFFRKQINRISK